MTVLIDKSSKIIIQGFTGKMGSFHAEEMIKYGSNVVGGVTPGKGGTKHLNLPVFNTVKDAVKNTGATASILFVPPAFAADSAMEAADAGIKTCVAIVDGIPSHDMIRIKRYMRRYTRSDKMTLVGPNCAGIISPGKSMLGIMPGHIYKEGRVGIISRSGTLGYEAAQQLKNLNIGISTSVGIGGDPINGSSFRDVIEKFEQDSETDAVLMIGEIGGPQEVAAGEFAKDNMKKPVIAYIAGLTAPKGRVMGHAGAIVSAYGESAIEKVDLSNFEKIIIGASIRYGNHSKELYKFINLNKNVLDQKKSAFFSVNVVARKLEKNTAETNPYINKFLKISKWKPNKIKVFAGKVDYPNYNFFDKYIIKLIMFITKGPTDTSRSYEFTDWSKVDDFSEELKNNY